jgi:putative radical SAM enzyme (TIGR03279 family)
LPMPCKNGIEVEGVAPGSAAEAAGLRRGDVLLALNGWPLRDAIDFMFYRGVETFTVEFLRDKSKTRVQLPGGGEDIGITVKPFKVKTCANNCLFCFVKQLPKGLRRSLYVKDEDYRLSFLYGNYMTLTNIDSRDKKRIVEQRLSPLYVSVHATNRTVRNKLIGNARAADVLKELKFFADNKIRYHTQIVLCPGYNDGKELQKTIRDLYKFYPYTSSIAVVPVGLTIHRKQLVQPVTRGDAVRAIELVESFQKRFQKKHGDPIVYCADEMYIKAERPFPSLKEYGALPQIENGVGMVPLFMSQSKKVKIPKSVSRATKFITFTGESFFPFLKKFITRLTEKENIDITLLPVENQFFGSSVSVAGLLTGRDVIKTLHDNIDSYKVLIVPDVVLKEGEDLFLDDVSLSDIQSATGLVVVRAESTPQGLIDAVASVTQTNSGP